ncbi:NlpC/P60 family protein [Micromonospora sp. WMMD1102]|uniref:C40 family peptidase n=1 Tax=Micromonospora sp. WMMD1102 TaxID=3016105 RepID=UPI0024152102|nr:NlpC/P60 family protein [Micromonospora sp. WMMD1102]MDG4789354.1 NlpC/P60 family protein [Micromonospora sp. WMMD1102]
MLTKKTARQHRTLSAILIAVPVFLATSFAMASPAVAAPIDNPSTEIPVGCPGARAVIQVEWEGTRSAKVHWELTDTSSDGKSPLIKIVANDGSGSGKSWVFRNDEVVFAVDGGYGASASGGGHSWDPGGIAQFNNLEVKVSNGSSGQGTICSVTKTTYNYTRLAYQYALNQSDKRYVLGAEGPDAYDCSGLVKFGYERVTNFPGWGSVRSSAQQYEWARSEANNNNADLSNLKSRDAIQVSRSKLKIGDLVFYSGHVGFYAGGGQLYSAMSPSAGIGYTSVDYTTPLGYYRVVGVTG